MKIFTIGFAGKNAETFFSLLKQAGVRSLIDIRLNNRSQLAGFTKSVDLEYFLKRLCDISYFHFPLLAPSSELLQAYRKQELDWKGYISRFMSLMQERDADTLIRTSLMDTPKPICLLCSESEAAMCHRSLVAKRIAELYPKAEIIHL